MGIRPAPVPELAAASAAGSDEAQSGPVGLADDRRLGLGDRAGRRLGALWEILRPFAYTASVIPVLTGGAIAVVDQNFSWLPFLAAMLGGVLLHSGTNIINEIYDVRKGIDTIVSPRASHALLKARLTERQAFVAAFVAFALAVLVGVYLVALRGPAIVGLGAPRPARRIFLHGAAVRNTSTGRWACPSCSC